MLARNGFGRAWVSCPEDDAAPPFWVWDQLLGQLGAGGAGRAGADETDPELARFLLLDAVTAGIRQAAADRPLLLVIDDLHWADQGSVRLLGPRRPFAGVKEPRTLQLAQASVGRDGRVVLMYRM